MLWIDVSQEPLSRDGIAQVLATVVTAILAVGAAWYGAKRGADSTRDATERSIRAELELAREMNRQQRIEQEASDILAFAAELRVNASTAANAIAHWHPIKMQTAAFSKVLEHYSLFSRSNREDIERVWRLVASYNAVAEAALFADARTGLMDLRNAGEEQAAILRPELLDLAAMAEEVAAKHR